MTKGIKTKYGKPILEWEDLERYVKDLEYKIDKIIEYLKLFDDNCTLIDHSIIKGALRILGDKENE